MLSKPVNRCKINLRRQHFRFHLFVGCWMYQFHRRRLCLLRWISRHLSHPRTTRTKRHCLPLAETSAAAAAGVIMIYTYIRMHPILRCAIEARSSNKMNGTNRYVWQRNQSITHEWMTKGEKNRNMIGVCAEFALVLCRYWEIRTLHAFYEHRHACSFSKRRINHLPHQRRSIQIETSENKYLRRAEILSEQKLKNQIHHFIVYSIGHCASGCCCRCVLMPVS